MTPYIDLKVKCTGYYGLDGKTFKRSHEYNIRVEKNRHYIKVTKYDDFIKYTNGKPLLNGSPFLFLYHEFLLEFEIL